MRLWPRRYIQPDYAIGSRPRVDHDCGVGDASALGAFLFAGMLGLVMTASGGRETPRDDGTGQRMLARADETTVKSPAVKSTARVNPKMKRRVVPSQRLAMVPRPSP